MISKKEYQYSVELGPDGPLPRAIAFGVEIQKNGASFPTEGIIDTGCGSIVINKSIAVAKFGVDLSKCKTRKFGGFGGVQNACISEVTLRFNDFDLEFETPVLFADFAGELVLGDPFFTHFNVVLERHKYKFTLIPITGLKK